MYDKIAQAVNDHLGYTGEDQEILAEDVEAHLRYQEAAYLDDHEIDLIEEYLEKFL